MKRVYAITLGCPKNRVDTERLLGGLHGHARVVSEMQDADYVLINTCGFIQPAVEESVRTILETVREIQGMENPPRLTVTGCLVQRFEQELRKEIPEVDIWLPIAGQPKWPSLLRATEDPGLERRVLSTPPGYAYLKIGEGCRYSCKFCIIPKLRGGLKSRPVESLKSEAATLVRQGVKEIILVAQDSTSYGQDLGMKNGLLRLLDALLPLQEQGLTWLRLLYLYPAGLTRELLQEMSRMGPPLLPSFDIPLQHAHPDVLKRMGRPFSRDPRAVVEDVRSFFPHAALRTSLIVGYPGETRAQFRTLLDFVRQTRFHNLGVFPFHPEEGTPAATMEDQVSARAKSRRRREIMEVQAEISGDILSAYEGEEIDVLTDTVHPEWPGLYLGRAWFQAPEVDGVTYVSGPGVSPGRMVTAQVVEAKTYDL
ncbi:MAG: 30S ribosomal protein S12 methylthiotransferase RimO, partial [Desulfovibrionales bacterium]